LGTTWKPDFSDEILLGNNLGTCKRDTYAYRSRLGEGLKVNVRIIAPLLLAAAAVLLGVVLAMFLPLILSVILDATPRTPFSTSSLVGQIRSALPAESLGLLGC